MLVGAYVAVVIATLAVLALLGVTGSDAATSSAWIHAAIVAWFAVLLPLRLRAARGGSERGRWAVAIIAAVSLAANVVEATLPGLFPAWMRIEMIGIAALMLAIVGADLARR
jgi:hypothetical protein